MEHQGSRRRMPVDGITALIRSAYRSSAPADAVACRVVARSSSAKLAVVAAHLIPAVAALVLPHHAREPISRALGVGQAAAQVGVIMTSIMVTLVAAALVAPRLVDRLPDRDVITLLGLTRVDRGGLLIASLFAAVVWLVPTEQLYEDAFSGWLQDSWLGLPAWHFQRTAAFGEIPPWVAAVALLANLMGEELWFRGYLYPKLTFLAGWTWPVAGVLFVAYHVFQAPVAYPGFLGGLALAGLYALRRDLWSCVLLHALLQAPL